MSAVSAARPSRRGGSLPELVVALTLLTVISALAGAALVGAERRLRSVTAFAQATHSVRDGAAVLAAELQGADSISVVADTAVDLLALVGTSAVCSMADRAVVLPPSQVAVGLPLTIWRASPAAGDIAALFDPSAARWLYRRIDSVATRTGIAGCTSAGGLITEADSTSRRPVTRIILDDVPFAGVPAGSPVRVLRRERWALYRGGTGTWSLGLRNCAPVAGCGSAQPATGALASARDSGFVIRFSADSASLVADFRSANTSVPVATSRVHVSLRNRVR